ncbi:hypothetical protein BS47DRAFT_1358167 [Hydnum rufescens UP504]|uniref:Uncharacterized protein n=1 Tax=Hydnum rufescens UP504 TaxID=1448309 RepID=A0A9P6B9V8_9AGAM|nr:hypothetical protein BS47DRAFT_1358167 [Hydnum rufescens UP504]
MLKKYNKAALASLFARLHSWKELTYMTTHPLPRFLWILVVESYITNEMAEEIEKRRACNLYDYATNTVPHTRRSGCVAILDNATRNTGACCRPRPKPLTIRKLYNTDQIRCHTPTEAGVWQYYVLSPCAKPHPKPAQTKAKAKYGRTQAPESPAPNTHSDRHDELNTIPYAAAAGVWSFLPPRNFTRPRIHRQGPGRNMGARTATQDDPQASLHDNESNTVPHARFGGLSPSAKPPCDECTDKARANYGHPHSHARFQRSTIHNQYNDELNTVPHTRQSGCVAILGTFSHCETPPKASTDEAQGEIPTYVATRKPSNHNEKLNTIPHTRFGGCVVLLAQWLTRSWPNKAPMGPQLAPKPQPK